MQRKIRWGAAILLVLLGAAVIAFPHLRGYVLERRSDEAAEQFLEAHMPPDKTESTVQENPFTVLLQQMKQYNQWLYESEQDILEESDAFSRSDIDLTPYDIADGVVGALEIPAISVHMPLLLGATPEHLALGACVLGGTSLPVGGENTNCVIAGHRGWHSAAYFRYLDQIQEGDTVQLTNLWGTLTYRVVEKRIIVPTDSDSILVQPGRDLLTLLTCHPYASGGKQRLVVYCERVGEDALYESWSA